MSTNQRSERDPCSPQQTPLTTLTRVAHELARNFLVAASAAEDLATESTMVTPSEGCEFLIAVVALFTLTVWHPVLFQITVLEHKDIIHNSYIQLQQQQKKKKTPLLYSVVDSIHI